MIKTLLLLIVGGFLMLLWFCLKLAIVLIITITPGFLVSIIFSKLKLTPIGIVLSTITFIYVIFESPFILVKILSIIMVIATIINLIQWLKCTSKKAVRNSELFKDDKYLIFTIYIAEIILMYNMPFNKYESFKTVSYILLIIYPILAPFMLNSALSYYKKINDIIIKKGIVSGADILNLIENENKSNNNSNQEEIDKKYNKVMNLLNNIYEFENRLVAFKGAYYMYYFNVSNYIDFKNNIRKFILKKEICTLDDIQNNIKTLLLLIDLKTFLLDELSDVSMVHNNNSIKFIVNNGVSNLNVCDCCRKYGYIEIDNEYGRFCSMECFEVIENITNKIHNNSAKKIVNLATVGALSNNAFNVLKKQQYFVNKYKTNGDASHGFAAEVVNTDIDKALGKKSFLKGTDNELNGADRVVNNINIQSKYYSTAQKSVNSAFNDTGYKYLNNDGSPMQLEVPRDQFIEAVEIMKEKIAQGKVKGIRDINEAERIIKPGYLTLNQAKNITKFGTIESVCYDFKEGTIVGLNSFGISSTIVFAIQIWNGNDVENAFSEALNSGLQVGIKTTTATFISAQLAKTSISKTLTKQFGEGVLKLNSNAVTLVVFQYRDFLDFFTGYLSGKQLVKNVVSTSAAFIAASKIGAKAGSFLGTIPGTLIGAITGGIVGAVTGKIFNEFSKSDAEKMQLILQEVFEMLAREYVLTNEEIKQAYISIYSDDNSNLLKQLYKAEDKYRYATHIILPEIGKCYSNRPTLTL